MSRVDSRLPRVDSRLTALVLTVALLQCASAFEWQSCGEGKADIKTVTLTPESPAPGVTVQFAINGIANIGVLAGTLNISVAYMGLPIYSEIRDLCDMTTCPIKEGDLVIAYDQYLPPIVPPGPYTVILVAGGTADQQLLCLEVDFDVVSPFGLAKNSLRTAAGRLGVGQESADIEQPARHSRAHA